MKTIRITVLAMIAAMSLVTLSGPAGSGLTLGCGPALSIKDPALRLLFAEIDRQRSAESSQVCAMYSQAIASAAVAH